MQKVSGKRHEGPPLLSSTSVGEKPLGSCLIETVVADPHCQECLEGRHTGGERKPVLAAAVAAAEMKVTQCQALETGQRREPRKILVRRSPNARGDVEVERAEVSEPSEIEDVHGYAARVTDGQRLQLWH